jgi:hypothetical protein
MAADAQKLIRQGAHERNCSLNTHFICKEIIVYSPQIHGCSSQIPHPVRTQMPETTWLQTNQPELAEPSPTSALTIANGNEVGAMARLNYPNGILIEHIRQPDLAVAETARLIANSPSVPLFEAAFIYAGALVRADVLSQALTAGEWLKLNPPAASKIITCWTVQYSCG